MPTLEELMNAINALLGVPGIPAVLQLNNVSLARAFEAYNFALLVTAIRQAGGMVTITGRNSGPNPAVVIFRGGGGLLGSTAQDFAYADCSLGNEEFELHIDVEYEGTSEAIHEIDVSLYDHAAAEKIRDNPGLFAKVEKLRGTVECKFYDSDLGVVLGRTFVGLVSDCGRRVFSAFVTNGHSPGLVRYFSPANRPLRFFGLSPLRPDEEHKFIAVVQNLLTKWAKVE